MTEQTPERRSRRKLPGNHRFWSAGTGGFAMWEPLDIDRVLRADTAVAGMDVDDIIENLYQPNEALSHAADPLAILVYDARDIAPWKMCQQYPYIINVLYGEDATPSDYYVVCPSLPALLATVVALGPLVGARDVSPIEQAVAAVMAVVERMEDTHDGPTDDADTPLSDMLDGLETGDLDAQLVCADCSSGYADQLIAMAIMERRFADAKRVCNRVEHLLPFDAELSKAEMLLARARIAEAQADLPSAEAWYRTLEQRLRDIAQMDNDVFIIAVIEQCRIARIHGQLDAAVAALERADAAVCHHARTQQERGEQPSHLRMIWCREAGMVYAAQWRAGGGEAGYQQAVASFEHIIDLAKNVPDDLSIPMSDDARLSLHALRRDHQRDQP